MRILCCEKKKILIVNIIKSLSKINFLIVKSMVQFIIDQHKNDSVITYFNLMVCDGDIVKFVNVGFVNDVSFEGRRRNFR